MLCWERLLLLPTPPCMRLGVGPSSSEEEEEEPEEVEEVEEEERQEPVPVDVTPLLLRR